MVGNVWQGFSGEFGEFVLCGGEKLKGGRQGGWTKQKAHPPPPNTHHQTHHPVAWWKHKHDQHHACPNELDGDTAAPLDPDIDTLPLIAWSRAQLATARGPRALLRSQHKYFVPLLLAARLAWAQSSATAAAALLQSPKTRGRGVLETALLALHYAWTLAPAIACLGLTGGLAYAGAAQLVAGLYLALVFVQSHNGMAVYSNVLDWMTAQAVSTRDVASTPWTDWFTGGLNYQLEHHAFPGLPRHALGSIAADVKALCEKHGLAYESVTMPVATSRVLQHLADVAALA
jgi:fatty acid desaturase